MVFRFAKMVYPLRGLNLKQPFSAMIDSITETVQNHLSAYTSNL